MHKYVTLKIVRPNNLTLSHAPHYRCRSIECAQWLAPPSDAPSPPILICIAIISLGCFDPHLVDVLIIWPRCRKVWCTTEGVDIVGTDIMIGSYIAVACVTVTGPPVSHIVQVEAFDHGGCVVDDLDTGYSGAFQTSRVRILE